MARCKHEREMCKVVTAELHWVDVFCTACKSRWQGRPYAYEARSHHFTTKPPRVVSPPRWVSRALPLDDDMTGDDYAARRSLTPPATR
jgi:hypothetical protein